MGKNKIEQYLIESAYGYREAGENIWIVDDPEHNLAEVAVMYNDPLAVFRVALMDAPQNNRLELFTKLLELNASDIVHGAYALENDQVVLVNTLDYDTMDYSEFRSTLESFSLALVQHYPILSNYRG
jgi:hypothetical protein